MPVYVFVLFNASLCIYVIQCISYFRQAIEKLMLINPLAEHVDLKDHYLAFIDLEKFGIEKEVPDER